MNLNNIVSPALSVLNPMRDVLLTRTIIEYKPESRKPIKTTEEIKLKGKVQPLNEQTVAELGFNLQEFQYYRFYVSYPITQLDKLRSLGSDRFIIDGNTYRLTGKWDWSYSGWTEGLCYLDEVKNG